jgi:elongation factor Ts
MTKITAAEVNKLRKQTGLGMMDCKKALVEAEGDFEKAIEILRKKGQKVAEKRGDRDAAEGHVLAITNDGGNEGVVLVLNSETDFVANNQDFIDFATNIANVALASKANSIEAVNSLSMEDGRTVQEHITDQIGKIGEKIEVSDYAYIANDAVVAYNHPGNNIASLVGLNKNVDGVAEAGKDVAMQIAAMAPVAVNGDEVAEEIKNKELEIGREQAIQEGKPEQIVDKIAQGKLNKFLKENTLLSQDFIKDNKKSVAEYLKSIDKELTVTSFKRISIAK